MRIHRGKFTTFKTENEVTHPVPHGTQISVICDPGYIDKSESMTVECVKGSYEPRSYTYLCQCKFRTFTFLLFFCKPKPLYAEEE